MPVQGWAKAGRNNVRLYVQKKAVDQLFFAPCFIHVSMSFSSHALSLRCPFGGMGLDTETREL